MVEPMRTPLILVTTLALVASPALARASDGASSRDSGNSSNGSSDASNGSGDSSRASGDSSNASGDSSNNSDGSSERSSEDSSKDSTQQSSDATSKGDGAKVITIAGAIILAGGLVAAGIGFGGTTTRRNQQEIAERRLQHFLRRHHAAVLRDVALARGPLLEGWTHDWGLTAAERSLLLESLDGSKEQVAMLRAMGRLNEPKAAAGFAADLCAVAERALGENRFRAIAPR